MPGRTDVAAGLTLGAIGVAVAVWSALNFDIGTPRRMGPGFFPLGLGVMLTGLGGVIAASAAPAKADKLRLALPELAAVLSAIVVFALGVERLGLIATTAATVLIASAAAPRRGVIWRLVLAAAVTAISALVFHILLRMTLPLWPA